MKIRDSTVPLLAEYARSGRVVVFDTETTGGRPYDEICQIAAVEYVNGTMTRTLALYICPTCEMNPWAEMVPGLSLEHAYHHLNFAWNGRFKTMREADAQFDRNEKFPYPHGAVGRFAKFCPKMARTSQ